MDTSRGLQPPE